VNPSALEARIELLESELREARARLSSPFLTRKEAAVFLHCSVAMVDDLLGRGIIPKHRLASMVLIRRDEAEAAVTTESCPANLRPAA